MSFIYPLQALSTTFASPLSFIATVKNSVLLPSQQVVLTEQPIADLAAESAVLPEQPEAVAVIRLFGDGISWSFLQQVISLLANTDQLTLTAIQPHPELAVALSVGLKNLLTEQQLAALQQLAQQQQAELVYLTTRPTLGQPGVLVMDMDSTAIQIECIDEIARLAGTGEQVAAVTARAMNGELDFAQSLVARVATLADAPAGILQQVLDKVPLMPGLTSLVSYLQQHNWQVAIASGGFTYFTDALKQRLALTATFANTLEIIDGKLTGKVLGDIVDAGKKAAVVTALAQQYQIPLAQTVAIGDGANDIPMLQTAALGVAFHAKPKVQAAAKAAVKQGSLLQLLYLLD